MSNKNDKYVEYFDYDEQQQRYGWVSVRVPDDAEPGEMPMEKLIHHDQALRGYTPPPVVNVDVAKE